LCRLVRGGCLWLLLWLAAGLTRSPCGFNATGARCLFLVAAAITSMTRVEAEPTYCTNAAAFDDDVVPRLFEAEERDGAGDGSTW
jgi:hypothetical protein